jgi:hypothetical protein
MIRKKLVLHRWFYVSGAVLVLALTFGSGVSSAELSDAEKDAIGRSVTNLFKATRKVISQSQKLINDKNSGEKGLTGDAVIEKAWKNYKESFKDDLGDLSSHPLKEKVLKSFEAATREVMTNAQPLINKRGLGFKRFLPAIFARHVSDSFNRIMDGKAQIKLTAPRNYIRNRTNRPDNWESNVIENFFKKNNYTKDKPFTEESSHKGKPAFRFIIPEYYSISCLKCHGEPKGAIDVSGGKKEGGKLGELAGAVSFVLYN